MKKVQEITYAGNKMTIEIEKDFYRITEGCVQKGDKTLNVAKGFQLARQEDIGSRVDGFYCVIRKLDPAIVWASKRKEAQDKRLEKKVVGKWYACRLNGQEVKTFNFDNLDVYKTFCCQMGVDWQEFAKDELRDSEIESLAWAKAKIKKEIDRICKEADVELDKINRKIEEVIRKTGETKPVETEKKEIEINGEKIVVDFPIGYHQVLIGKSMKDDMAFNPGRKCFQVLTPVGCKQPVDCFKYLIRKTKVKK